MADDKKNDEEVSKMEADEKRKQEEEVRANAQSDQSKQVDQEKTVNSTCDSSMPPELRSASLSKDNSLNESKDKAQSLEHNEGQAISLPRHSRLSSAANSAGSFSPQVQTQSAYERYACVLNRRLNLLTGRGITKDSKVGNGILTRAKSDQIKRDIKQQLKSVSKAADRNKERTIKQKKDERN